MCKVIVRKAVDMLCDITGQRCIFLSQFLNDKQKPSLVALCHGTDCLSKYGELLAVPRGNTCKECQNINRKAFSVLNVFHNHERVKQSSVSSVAGKVYDIDFMGYLWECFFPVPTLALRVKDNCLSAKQYGIINKKIVAE